MRTPTAMRWTVTAIGLMLVAGCGRPQPMGDRNAVILAVPDAEWPAIQDQVEEVLEPTAFAVYDERIFRVTQVDPLGPFWGDTRRFQNVVVVGEPGDPWVAEALRRASAQPTELPALVQARNVWARGQQVFALVVAPGTQVSTIEPLLSEVATRLLDQYQVSVRQRMFASGVDTARIGEVEREAGFRLVAPSVYRVERIDDQTYRFLNDQPDPSQLQRSVLVSLEPGLEAIPSPEEMLRWRDQVADRHYEPGQATLRERVESVRPGATNGFADAAQIQGSWTSLPGAWPAGGPFLTRAILCPDGRTYLLDAWLYAPGREKYEYMFQLNTILDSFACAESNAR